MSLNSNIRTETRTGILIFLCILAVYGLSYYKRRVSYDIWMQTPGVYRVDGVTAMATRDAYWWLKMARDLDAGRLGTELPDPTKEYPDLAGYPQEPNLLARLISLSKNFTGGDYYRAALLLVPILAGLFVFPLFCYGQALGFGAATILGGLIGSFSLAYYGRSTMGNVDTDLLNLFFPLAVSACMVAIRPDRTLRRNLLLAMGAGFMLYLFNCWYQQPLFYLLYLPFLALYLGLMRVPGKHLAWLLLAFTLATGPSCVAASFASLQNFIRAFFLPPPTGQIVWPDMMTLIQEAQPLDPLTQLQIIYNAPPLVFAGLAGLLWLYVIRPKRMVPLTPLLLIGLWSLLGPRRFAMYLAPFIGLGLGVLLELACRKIAARCHWPPFASPLLAMMLMWTVFFATLGASAYDYLPQPTVSAATTRAFLDIKARVPKHAAMFTSWSYGYPLMELGEFATYHDGSAHDGLRPTLISRAFTSTQQRDMVALIACLEDYGVEGLRQLILEKNLSGDQLLATVFNHSTRVLKDDIYVLYTEDMIGVFASISSIGNWDFERQTGTPLRYVKLHFFAQNNQFIDCKEGRIDLDRGTVKDATTVVPLKAALIVKGGQVIQRFDYPEREGVYLQILLKPNQLPDIQLVEEPLFRTNFNQQYLLGNVDPNYFEEVYNNFPVARLLKVKSGVAP